MEVSLQASHTAQRLSDTRRQPVSPPTISAFQVPGMQVTRRTTVPQSFFAAISYYYYFLHHFNYLPLRGRSQRVSHAHQDLSIHSPALGLYI
jgi:hypothetical protein